MGTLSYGPPSVLIQRLEGVYLDMRHNIIVDGWVLLRNVTLARKFLNHIASFVIALVLEWITNGKVSN